MQHHLDIQGFVSPIEDAKSQPFAESSEAKTRRPLFDWRIAPARTDLPESAGELLAALDRSVAHLRLIDENCGHDRLIGEIEDLVRQIDEELSSLG
jgi:hypothetical protein